ncbi:MAG: DUF4214 domain-containing protein [Pigmentiphaga sp.]
MDHAQARELLQRLYTTHSNTLLTTFALENFESLIPYFGVERAYTDIVANLYSRAALADYQELLFPAELRWQPSQSLDEYNTSLPSSVVLGLLFPQAPAELVEGLRNLLDTQQISNLDLLHGWTLLPPGPLPEWDAMLAALRENPYVRAEGWLALPDLDLPFLAAADVHWLLAIYVAAFGRAPDPEGLRYWAEQMQTALADDADRLHTLQTLAGHIDWAGQQNREAGSDLPPTQYVAQIYQQVLGREADPYGLQYWTDGLTSGEIPRGQFLAHFLYSALNGTGDAGYLQARIAVAGHATHALQLDPAANLDLIEVLEGVHHVASALAAIALLPPRIGDAPSSVSPLAAAEATWFAALSPAFEVEPAAAPYEDPPEPGGVSLSSADDWPGFLSSPEATW